MSSTLSNWIAATRPKTLSAAITPVAMGCAVAHGEDALRWKPALAALLGALAVQIACNFANDYFDGVQGTDTVDRLGPRRAVASGLISPHAMWRATWLVLALVALPACVVLISSGGWIFAPLGAVSAALAFAYSGGTYALSRTGLGEPFAFLFFGPIAVAATVAAQTREWTAIAAIAGCAPGLLATALICVNNLRDEPTDRSAGRRTLAVRFGPALMRALYGAAIAGVTAITIAVVLMEDRRWALLALAAPMLLLPSAWRIGRGSAGRALNRELALTGFALLLYGALFTVGWVA
jgi:1,4-dihydroxy-2-naphthoate octaprenyltransferase